LVRSGFAGPAEGRRLDSVHYPARPGLLLIAHAYNLVVLSPEFFPATTRASPGPASAHTSFADSVDLETFHINEDVWPEALSKASVFLKLGSYLLPESTVLPRVSVIR
jgi:hypothetical protein